MSIYDEKALIELKIWHKKMLKKPSIGSRITKKIQRKTNEFIPEKAHQIITKSIKNMVKVVLKGSQFSTKPPTLNISLQEREKLILEKISFYKKSAVLTGAGTGAGGLLIGLADFPILLSLKMKFLFDIASLYGFDVKDYKERIYILYVFQLAFSSEVEVFNVYKQIYNWDRNCKELPNDIEKFDWRKFQQEYRDYIDLVKMLQLVPFIGASVGAYANYKLMNKLAETAINAYRLRIFHNI